MQEADVMGWENEFQGQAADSIKLKKHGDRDSTWWQGRGHQIFQNEGKRESEGAECRVKRGHLIYGPWGNILAGQTVGLRLLSAPRTALGPCPTQEFRGLCPSKAPPILPHSTEMNSQLPYRSLAINGPFQEGKQDWWG